MKKQKTIAKMRRRKALHVRRVLRRDPVRPRLSVYRSRSQIYCQVIDDLEGKTLCAASSLDKEIRDSLKGVKKAEAAEKVGEVLAERALAKGIKKVKFDRGWHRYHGRVKALAEGARKAGLEF
ncbi:MAG TPA: 50S ribosomal protein L18 [Planctomycetes bacterium]|nr:50S ribosomal protein L18 [Planctomycetota bacterium]